MSYNEEEVLEPQVSLQMVSASHLNEIVKAEIDQQISTAKAYPRDITSAKKSMLTQATMTPEIAATMYYKLPRRQKTDNGWEQKWIEGPSVRLAEIAAGNWGNCSVGARIVAIDAQFITAQGIFHDLETNVRFQVEVKRKIVDKKGKRFSEDMVVVTGNAAASIALRNAIFKGINKSYIEPIWQEAKKVANGNALPIEVRRQNALAYFTVKKAVPLERVLAVLEVNRIEEIGVEHLENLIGMKVALDEEASSIDELFPPIEQTKSEKITENATVHQQIAGDSINQTDQDPTKLFDDDAPKNEQVLNRARRSRGSSNS